MLSVLKWVTRSLVGVIAIAISVAVFAFLVRSKPAPPQAEVAFETITVGAVPVSEAEVDRLWSGYGTARALRSVDVPAEITAMVLDRPDGINDGVWVTAGKTVLLTLDNEDLLQRVTAAGQRIVAIDAQSESLRAQRDRLDERLSLLREQETIRATDLERLREAFEQGASRQTDLDARVELLLQIQQQINQVLTERDTIDPRLEELSANRSALESERETLNRDAYNRATIVAPISGFLQDVTAQEGAWLSPGARVAGIVDLRRIEIPLRLPMSAALSLRIGDPVVLTARTGDDGAWGGRIARISPDTDPASRSVTVFVVVNQTDLLEAHLGVEPGSLADNRDNTSPDPSPSPEQRAIDAPVDLNGRSPASTLLRPGMFVTGEVRTAPGGAQMIVPRRAVRDGRVVKLLPNGDLTPSQRQASAVAPARNPAPNGDAKPVSAAGTDDPGWRAVVRPVTILYSIRASLPEIIPGEVEWVVIKPEGEDGKDGLNLGDIIVYEGLDKIAPGIRVSPILPGGKKASGS